MIFKIQKPIVSTEGQPYYIYNKDRSIETMSLQVGDIPEVDKLFNENEMKIYVKGYLDKKNRIIFNRRVEEQDW